MTLDTEWWFNNNNDFRNYVEKYIFKHHVTLEEALKHVAVLEYALYLKEEERNGQSSVSGRDVHITCGC